MPAPQLIDRSSNEARVVCPHCNRELKQIVRVRPSGEGFFGGLLEQQHIYVCGFEDCSKVLSIGYNLGT